jgi:hypothetical protein
VGAARHCYAQVSLPSPRRPRDSQEPTRAGRPVIVSPEAAREIDRVEDALAPSDADAFEAALTAALDALADAEPAPGSDAAIARRRIGAFPHALLYVVERRRVLVAALVRAKPKANG